MMSLSVEHEEAAREAIEIVNGVLSDHGTPARLAQYYDRETKFAGATFVGLGENHPTAITAEDLLAVTTLDVSIECRPTRWFLEDDEVKRQVAVRLRELPDGPLGEVDDDGKQAMSEFYELVKRTLATPGARDSDRWVAASKVTARKRPDLFPVRDRVVRNGLNIMRFGDYGVDWPIFQRIITDEGVMSRLKALPGQIKDCAGNRPVDLDGEPLLRLLDAAMWTTFSERNRSSSD